MDTVAPGMEKRFLKVANPLIGRVARNPFSSDKIFTIH